MSTRNGFMGLEHAKLLLHNILEVTTPLQAGLYNEMAGALT